MWPHRTANRHQLLPRQHRESLEGLNNERNRELTQNGCIARVPYGKISQLFVFLSGIRAIAGVDYLEMDRGQSQAPFTSSKTPSKELERQVLTTITFHVSHLSLEYENWQIGFLSFHCLRVPYQGTTKGDDPSRDHPQHGKNGIKSHLLNSDPSRSSVLSAAGATTGGLGGGDHDLGGDGGISGSDEDSACPVGGVLDVSSLVASLQALNGAVVGGDERLSRALESPLGSGALTTLLGEAGTEGDLGAEESTDHGSELHVGDVRIEDLNERWT